MSDQAPAIIPSLRYDDARAAIDWLVDAFGFQRRAVYEHDGEIMHAELTYDDGMLMMGSARENDQHGRHTGQGWNYVIVTDPDAHYERAKAAGAEIIRELEDQDYGSRDYSARDPEGNVWSFGTYRPGMLPE
jgi:uncharacterized glyoxalase superfamily protein PhnB